MKTINEKQDEIIEEFSGLDDWMDRYQLLIDLGNEQEPLDEQYKTESNLIDGCQSRVWLVASASPAPSEGGESSSPPSEGLGEAVLLHFQAESDALIVKGIVSLLIRVLNDSTPQEILDADLYFIDEIGLREHLSPTRSNGLLAMIKQMRMYAMAFTVKG
jgi:cysteine desulfuration protein SufE